MAENTKIEWATHTFNPWIGCTRVSPACDNCYAAEMMDNRYGRVRWGAGEARVRTKDWSKPRKWNREAERTGERPFVFTNLKNGKGVDVVTAFIQRQGGLG